MGSAKKLAVWIGAFLVLCAAALLFPSFWTLLFLGAIFVLNVWAFHTRFIRRRKRQYPLIPPEGKPDWYLPLTNIPRPVIEDFRKEEEKKRKFSRIRKIVYRTMKPKRK